MTLNNSDCWRSESCRSVVSIVEMNYLQPTRNKQDFKDCYKYVARFLHECLQFLNLSSESETRRILPRKKSVVS